MANKNWLEIKDSINELTTKGFSLNKSIEYLGLKKTTVRDNLKKLGYEYCYTQKKYVRAEDKILNDPGAKDMQKQKVNEIDENLKNILLEQQQELFKRVKALEESISNSSSSKEKEILNKLSFKSFTGVSVAKTFRIYSHTLEKFEDMCNKDLSQYKKLDLITQALEEFIEKYKKAQ